MDDGTQETVHLLSYITILHKQTETNLTISNSLEIAKFNPSTNHLGSIFYQFFKRWSFIIFELITNRSSSHNFCLANRLH